MSPRSSSWLLGLLVDRHDRFAAVRPSENFIDEETAPRLAEWLVGLYADQVHPALRQDCKIVHMVAIPLWGVLRGRAKGA
jgi:hypothetical protein